MSGDHFSAAAFRDGSAWRSAAWRLLRFSVLLQGGGGSCSLRRLFPDAVRPPPLFTPLVSGDNPLPGLTDTEKPRMRGPKRASKIRKLFNLEKADDVRKYVNTYRRKFQDKVRIPVSSILRTPRARSAVPRTSLRISAGGLRRTPCLMRSVHTQLLRCSRDTTLSHLRYGAADSRRVASPLARPGRPTARRRRSSAS